MDMGDYQSDSRRGVVVLKSPSCLKKEVPTMLKYVYSKRNFVTGSCVLPCLFRSVKVVCSCLPVLEYDKVKTLPFACGDQIISNPIQSTAPPVLLELRERMVVLKWELNMLIDT